MSRTTVLMPRKRKPPAVEESPKGDTPKGKAASDVIRVKADLAYMLGVIGSIRGCSISELVEPALRPLVERWYDEALEEAASRREGK